MEFLKSHIKKYFGLPDDVVSDLASAFKSERLEKGQFFLREGAYCDRMSIVEQGYIRMYRLVEDQEVTHWVSGPGIFATDLASFMFNKPSTWNLQAISAVQVHTIYRAAYDQLHLSIPQWKELERRFLASCFVMLEERMFSQLAMDAEQRYEHLLATQPDLVREVPLQYLASMLGMKPETLSRVRKKAQRSIS